MNKFRHFVVGLLGCVGLFGTTVALALQVTSLSPQGEVTQTRQLVAKFDGPATVFGGPAAPAPFTVNCSNPQAARGSGRWVSDREWAFEFDDDLSPGVRCAVQAQPGFRSPKGEALSGKTTFAFNTGGPFVQNLWPNTYEQIDEEQYFVLQLNGPAAPPTVVANVWCAVDGLGEKVPVRLIEGRERADLLALKGLTKAAARTPLRFVTLTCNRRLAAGGKMQLVYGKGVSTPATDSTGRASKAGGEAGSKAGSAAGGKEADKAEDKVLANRIEKRFAFQVREPFTASFSCERENAQAACLSIRPFTLSFSAPVPRTLAEGVVLRSTKTSYKPQWDREQATDALVDRVSFAGPLPEQTAFTLTLPPDFKDAAGRNLANADNFPLKVATGLLPPLAKFAAAPFGIVERYAEPDSDRTGSLALLPVTLRRVEARLSVKALTAGQVSTLAPQTDADIVSWMRRVQRYDNFSVDRKRAAADSLTPLPRVLEPDGDTAVQSRMVSLLEGKSGVKTLSLPPPQEQDTRPFEVVGIPLPTGFHVVEIASPALGDALLDERHGAKRTMFVRTSALVTNLGVHFKLGRENAAVWVTTLDKGQPVADARVQVSDCSGRLLTTGRTDARGVVMLNGLDPQPPACKDEDYRRAYFVSARTADDMAFTWSDWYRGIEPWRFNVPTSRDAVPDQRAHTVLDRTLLQAGETVSMKHILRTETGAGFGLPAQSPQTLVITHVGSGQSFSQDLNWRSTASGGRSAESSFKLPPAAKLGLYQLALQTRAAPAAGKAAAEPSGERSDITGQFRVEAFRLPVLEGRIRPIDTKPLINASAVPGEVQVNYVAGGPAARLPVRVSALLRAKDLAFSDFEDFSFAPPRGQRDTRSGGEEEAGAARDQRVVADKLPVVLDIKGAGRFSIDKLPASRQPQELLLEASYADPNGEVQTLRSVNTLWPSGVIAGLRTEGWISVKQKARFQALALDLGGKAKADVPLEVKAISHITTSSRKRMVGGFYSYDNSTETRDLGTVCSGRSDSRGLLQCDVKLTEPGEVELIVSAKDKSGNIAQAAGTVWVTRQGEIWFGGDNSDRIDLLPEKKSYEPGETARFQVRMPFRFATALVTVEREGIIDTQVVQLNGKDPSVSLKVQEGWGPNVYVSVLALRGRLRDVPWYSFFTWGFKAPREWWTAYRVEGRDHVAPTALVDLSKPAFRLGLAEIRVGNRAHQLTVKVVADRASYPVRGMAQVTISALLPNGQPAAGAEVAVAAVDQALLELMPNTSWNLLDAMLQRRAWGVETSTAQMEIIGRRHYGRKAVPAGGGGGRSSTRELLDTLLLWNPAVVLDAKGQAVVKVPLNDALTRFAIVAVADSGTNHFGTGQTSIQTTQDLQIISGLPPLVREDDQFRAQFTLRNTTGQAMKVQVTPRATLLELAPQVVDIPAGEAREIHWRVTAPTALAQTRAEALLWEVEARDTQSGARDALKVRQRIIPAVPIEVQQATLVQVDGRFSLDVGPPADALSARANAQGPRRGGLRLALQPRLAGPADGGLPGVRDWFTNYPFICLEQKASRALGLRDVQQWQSVVSQLPAYLDSDGLANYFPPAGASDSRGSDTLTAYLLAASHEAASVNPSFALPDAVRVPMERGLIAFVEGRLSRDFWSPRQGKGGDLDVRKLAALDALSRHGKAEARMLDSISVSPGQWPTSAVIDWVDTLKRVTAAPQRTPRVAEAMQVLRARLSSQGSRISFSTEQDDHWWWLMTNGDVNAARLVLAVIDDPAWKDDMPRLVTGFLGRQQRGAWSTTTANLWGSLALEKFSQRFESLPVTGITRASLGDTSGTVDWSRTEPAKTADQRDQRINLPWGAPGQGQAQTLTQTLTVSQQGSGKPWLTVQSLAAVAPKSPVNAGYQVSRTVTAVEQAVAGQYSRGDVLRVKLDINAGADMSWVVVSDPVPTGATLLGSGLGRDSNIATQGEQRPSGNAWPVYEERSFEALRAYYAYVPKGRFTLEYTVRLNNSGVFSLPPSRVEAMYAPEMFGLLPNAGLTVGPGR